MKLFSKKNKEKIRTLFLIVVLALLLQISHIYCPIKWLTGISCGGCGLTRALLAFCKGEIKEAFYYHPLFWLAIITVIIYFLYDEKAKGFYYFVIFAFTVCYIIRLLEGNNQIVNIDLKQSIIYRILKWR